MQRGPGSRLKIPPGDSPESLPEGHLPRGRPLFRSNEYRDRAVELVYFVPETPSTGSPHPADHDDLADLIDARNGHAQEMMNLLHAAQQDAVGG